MSMLSARRLIKGYRRNQENQECIATTSYITLYSTFILPLLDYGDVIWGDKINDNIMSELQILQNKAAKAPLGHPLRSSSTEALRSLDLKSLSVRRFFHRCTAIHKCLIGETDFNFKFIKNQAVHSYNTITQDVPMIFVYPFRELTGVNKL